MNTTTTDYEAHAQRIAQSLGLTVVAAFKGDRCPPWAKDHQTRGRNACPECLNVHGDRYRVTLKLTRAWTGHPFDEPPRSLSFDYWASYHDKQTGERPGYYDVLVCVASDAGGPTDPDEVAEEYGPMRPSRAIAIAKQSAKLQAFFTEAELTALQEIQ